MSSIENNNLNKIKENNNNLSNNSKQKDNNVDNVLLINNESTHKTREIETITDICCSDNLPEVQLISLLDEEIPLYKLRADSLFSHNNTDWVQAPLFIDEQEINELDNEQIRYTLDYFILSGFRVSQMTKTYYDIEACNKLLQEKEKDVELAATIGKTLLDKNQSLEDKIHNLEIQLEKTTDMVNQLSYELNLKEDLLKTFIEFENEKNSELNVSLNLANQSTRTYSSIDSQFDFNNEYDSSRELDSLKRRLSVLEDKNLILTNDFDNYFNDSSIKYDDDLNGQKSDKTLIETYSKELADANSKIETLQEEINKKTKDNSQQQDDIDHLYEQIQELQAKLKSLLVENDELKSIIFNAASDQNILVNEINDMKVKYEDCCELLKLTQEELKEVRRKYSKRSEIRQLRYQQLYSPWLTANSLAVELQQEQQANTFKEKQKAFEFVKNVKEKLIKTIPGSNIDSCFQSDSDFESSIKTDITTSREQNLNNSTFYSQNCQTPDSLLTSTIGSSSIVSSSISHKKIRPYLPEKIQIVKPIEGSQTLQYWQQLAKPNLGCVLEPRPGIYLPKGDTIQEDDSEDADTESIEDELDYEYDESLEDSLKREPHSLSPQPTKEFTQDQVKLLEKLLNSNQTSPNSGEKEIQTSTSPTLTNKLNEIKTITSKYYNLNTLNIKIDKYKFKNLNIYDQLRKINLLGKIKKPKKQTDTPPSSPIHFKNQTIPSTPPVTPTKDFERLFNHDDSSISFNQYSNYFNQIVNKLKTFTNTIQPTNETNTKIIKPKAIRLDRQNHLSSPTSSTPSPTLQFKPDTSTTTPPPSPNLVFDLESNTNKIDEKSAFIKLTKLNPLINKSIDSKEDPLLITTQEKTTTPPPSPNFTFDDNNKIDTQNLNDNSAFLKITQLNPLLNKSIDLADLLGSVSYLKRTNKR